MSRKFSMEIAVSFFGGVDSCGVVDDDLPALVGLFEDQGEEALGVAAVFFGAFKLVLTDAYGEVFVERVDLKLGEGEGPHRGLGGVVATILLDESGVSTGDLVGEKDGVGRVFVGFGEGVDVAAVPRSLLGEGDLDDVEFLLGGGM